MKYHIQYSPSLDHIIGGGAFQDGDTEDKRLLRFRFERHLLQLVVHAILYRNCTLNCYAALQRP
jgi:hypothetical protein